MIIGKLWHLDRKEHEFHMKDDKFMNTSEFLEEFAVCLNSPWGQSQEKYTIKYNCKDSYTEKDESEPDWKCEYKVIGYELITSEIYGYGNTPQEALENCINLFERLQKEFNKENESF